MAKYCLKHLETGSTEVNSLANILVESSDYLTLIETFIDTPEKLNNIFNFLDGNHLRNLFDYLKSTEHLKPFFNQMDQSSSLFSYKLIAMAVLQDVPEEFYKEPFMREYSMVTVVTAEMVKRIGSTEGIHPFMGIF